MPLKGFSCMIDDSLVSFDECIECADTKHPCEFTSSILAGMAKVNEERKNAGISMTMITGCLRKSYYTVVKPYYVAPSILWPAYRGTFLHKLLENSSLPHLITEQRFCREFDGVKLTGQPDTIDLNRKLLTDYKSSDKVKDKIPYEYILQINGYRLIVQDGVNINTGEIVHYDIEQLGLVWITMMSVSKVAVPIIDEAEEVITRNLAILNNSIMNRKPPIRNCSKPSSSMFCTEYCAFTDLCIEQGDK